VERILPTIPLHEHIFIEAGTPYIKKEGLNGIRRISRLWKGFIVADLKTVDGAEEEVYMAAKSGAHAVTALGLAPIETLDFFTKTCKKWGVYSMIDMIGTQNPLRKLTPLKIKPDVVIIHKGRDEEVNPRNIISYKDINKISSKYDVLISVAGGLDSENLHKAYFNGANIAVLNIVGEQDFNRGLSEGSNFRTLIPDLLTQTKIQSH
jgi:bifunctional enzyme Fae/Hps